MGKKGSWFSAIKRVFIPNSKEKLANESEKKGVKEKKRWGIGRLKHGDKHSFIPLYREPSSIEKILGDVEREHHRTLPMPSREPQGTPPLPIRDQQSSPSMPSVDHQQPHSMSMRAYHYKVIQSPNYHQIAATKIQTAYRGYMARRSFRALKGLVRLQGVVRGHSVRRQTMNAMRCMQLLVRVQSQIHSRRIQMMENQALQRQNLPKVDKELESCLSKGTLTQMAEAEEQEEWDDSLLTREEIESRMQRKVEAVIKRERALAYAYSHQLWKATPKSAHTALMEIRSGGFPWWWSWIERQLPAQASDNTIMHARNILTPPKPHTEPTAQLRPNNYRQAKFGIDVFDAATPKSARSSPAVRMRHMHTPTIKTPQADTSTQLRHMKARASMDEHLLGAKPLRDDESLTSCPPFSVPNYMVPTVSAKAKVRAHSIPKERSTGQELKKRLSFPLRQSIGSLFTGKDSASQRFSRDHKSIQSIGNVSVDSTLSLPATVGRKPFQRFV